MQSLLASTTRKFTLFCIDNRSSFCSIIASSLGQPNLAIYFNLGARSNVSNIIGCIAGFPNVGGLIGVPLIAWSADKFGRRKAMLLCCVCA
jgi:MFS family permease